MVGRASVLLVVSALVFGCASPPAKAATAPRSKQQKLEDALTTEPCDRDATTALATMYLATDPRAAVDRARAYLAACGDDDGIRELKLRAHEHLDEWQAALGDANQLVAHAPRSPDARTLRADIYEHLGQRQAAADDRGRTTDSPAPTYTAPLLAGPPTKPVDRTRADAPTVDDIAPDVMPSPSPIPTPRRTTAVSDTPGKAVIHYTPGNVATTTVVLNGQVKVEMMVDTGASHVTFSRHVADKLGIDVTNLPTAQTQTAGGVRTVWVTMLPEVRVGSLTAANVTCIIGDDKDMGGGNLGLLGQSFLGHFKTTQDAEHGEIIISNR